jgi:two-component system, NarL family, invasion response regulator UvrY
MKRVLFVDQHTLFRQILGMVLKWNTDLKETVEANSLAEVRQVLDNSNHRPDLAVVNLDLANGDVFELIEELRMSAPAVPVLAITLRQDVDQRERALGAGAREVLTMAASPKEIVDTANQLLGE